MNLKSIGQAARILLVALVTGFAVLLGFPCAAGEPRPLVQAHAHNDYEHTHPLVDALDCGFCSVEADIHLVGGKLLVAHSLAQTKADRTLESLYLDPLRERIRRNGGRVYAGGPAVTLLIDIKTDRAKTYPALRKVLENYAPILNHYGANPQLTNAINVVLTGDRGRELFQGETTRLAGLDGGLEDLDSNEPSDLIPWISSDWTTSFHWRGKGALPADERAKLKTIVDKAHAHGRRLRFWGAPDNRAFWEEMLKQGVDLINTDNLPGLQQFLLSRP